MRGSNFQETISYFLDKYDRKIGEFQLVYLTVVVLVKKSVNTGWCLHNLHF